ncbi:hypothetical protein [Macellibacteroides fermentans]|jgi:hypothetical protein|uniref:hypothetical protein n=1 Tax=Macellibacteroides fermentans TaxID=879969 RepID=UPI00406D4B6F
MKTNMSLFRFSIVDFLLLLLFNTIVFVGLIGGINFLLGQSFFSGPSSSWIVILPFVILHPLLRSIWNRNGILIIEDEQTYLYKSNSIHKFLIQKGYVITRQNETEIIYDKGNRLSRFLNIIFREYIQINYINNEIRIHAKRNLLNEFVCKIEKINKSY